MGRPHAEGPTNSYNSGNKVAKLYYNRMAGAGVGPETREVSASDSRCEPAKESRKECYPKVRGKPSSKSDSTQSRQLETNS